MSEKDKKDTTNVEGTETGKKTQKDADSVIEVRHTYQTSKDSTPVKDKTPDKEPTTKPETDVKEPTGESATKEEKIDVVQPSLKELQAQLAAEKKKRESLELIVEAEATKDFETEKTNFLGLIPDEEKRTELSEKIGDDPTILNEYKRMSSFLTGALERAGVKIAGKPEKESEEKSTEETGTGEGDAAVTAETTDDDDVVPEQSKSGRAVLPETKNAGVVAGSYKDYVDELYNILKDPNKSVGEKEIADKQVNALFLEMTKGMKTTGQYAHLPPISACPSCGYILSDPENETCPRCGWKHMLQGIKTR